MMLLSHIDLYALLPEIYILCNALILLVWGVSQKKKEANLLISWLCAMVLVGEFFIIHLAQNDPLGSVGTIFDVGSFARIMKSFVLFAALSLFIFGLTTSEKKLFRSFEFPLLILFSVLGMMIMISANDFLILFMGMELQALPLYILVAFRKDVGHATEVGLKYFVLGAISTGMFLFGISFLYGISGTTQFEVIAQSCMTLNPGSILGMSFILAALCFKCSLAPFHMWTPDIYEGTSTPIALLLASASKVTAVGVVVRLIYSSGLFSLKAAFWPLATISILSMLVGALGALTQTNLKRLLAYSTIGHMGYVMAAFTSGEGGQPALIYIIIYMITTVCVFGSLMILTNELKGEGGIKIQNLCGLAKRYPLVAAALAVMMFSLAGIPPLGGFFGKLLVFKALISSQGSLILPIVGVILSVVSCFYYLNIVKVMYFDPVPENAPSPIPMSFIHRVFLLQFLGATVLFCFIIPVLMGYLENIF